MSTPSFYPILASNPWDLPNWTTWLIGIIAVAIWTFFILVTDRRYVRKLEYDMARKEDEKNHKDFQSSVKVDMDAAMARAEQIEASVMKRIAEILEAKQRYYEETSRCLTEIKAEMAKNNLALTKEVAEMKGELRATLHKPSSN